MATLTHNANTSKHLGCAGGYQPSGDQAPTAVSVNAGFNYDHAAAREECRKDSAATLNSDFRQLADDLADFLGKLRAHRDEFGPIAPAGVKALAMLGQQALNMAVALRHGPTPGEPVSKGQAWDERNHYGKEARDY